MLRLRIGSGLIFMILFATASVFAACASSQKSSEADAMPTELSQVAEPAALADKPAESSSNPALSTFILGPGDVLEIKAWRLNDLDQTVVVDSEGVASLYPTGPVKMEGLTAYEAKLQVAEGFSEYYREPKFNLNITSSRGRKIFVLGEVNLPGVYLYDQDITALEAIAMAGGFTRRGESRSVVVVRDSHLEKPEIMLVNLRSTLTGKNVENVTLAKGDVVYVPTSFMGKVDEVFEHLATILYPVVELERGLALIPSVERALKGDDNDGDRTIIISP